MEKWRSTLVMVVVYAQPPKAFFADHGKAAAESTGGIQSGGHRNPAISILCKQHLIVIWICLEKLFLCDIFKLHS
jgi:hypothetical protein